MGRQSSSHSRRWTRVVAVWLALLALALTLGQGRSQAQVATAKDRAALKLTRWDRAWGFLGTTRLEIQLTSKEFEQWGKEKYVSEPELLTLRWWTGETVAVGAEWEVSAADGVPVASGTLDGAPAAGGRQLFSIPGDSFLPAGGRRSTTRYTIRVIPYDSQREPLGPPSPPVVLDHGPPGEPTQFDEDMGIEPPVYVHPEGHPKVRFLHYAPLTQTRAGGLRLEAYNDQAEATHPVDLRITDLELVARQKEGWVRVPSLAPGAVRPVEFTLVPQLTKGSPTVEGDWQKWRERYANGVYILAGTQKVGSAATRYHQPPLYRHGAGLSSCANGVTDGDEQDLDCGPGCPSACQDCFAAASPGSGDAAPYFSLGSQYVAAVAMTAKFEYLNYLSTEEGRDESLDIFRPAKVGGDYASRNVIRAVARYVDTHMDYFLDDPDDWDEAPAEKTIRTSGGRWGASGDKKEGTEDLVMGPCLNRYCGDCEDHAFLRFALLRAMGIGRRCAWVADHHNDFDQGQRTCGKLSKKGDSDGHTYNLVYWKGKYRILDYSSEVYETNSIQCWDQHATDNIFHDAYGEHWDAEGENLSPTGSLHHNYPGDHTCGGPSWNFRTYYRDLCP
jgi:hypothetical protein